MSKKSFFEKLTGASFSSEDEEKEIIDNAEEETDIDDTEINIDDDDSVSDVEIEEKEELQRPTPKAEEPLKSEALPEIQNAKTTITAKPQSFTAQHIEPKNEIINESEGQLTIDVYQTPNDIIIKSTIAGVDPDNIDINITNDMITIKGNRQKDENVQDGDYYYQECYWGPFSRSVILPVDVESDSASASMKNGILTVRLPKAEKVRVKKISISTE